MSDNDVTRQAYQAGHRDALHETSLAVKRAYADGYATALVEAARDIDEKHNEYFNAPDRVSWYKATAMREASGIVRRNRKEVR